MSMQETYEKIKKYHDSTLIILKWMDALSRAFTGFVTPIMESGGRFEFTQNGLKVILMPTAGRAEFYVKRHVQDLQGKSGDTWIHVDTTISKLGDRADALTMDELLYALAHIRVFLSEAVTEVLKRETTPFDSMLEFFKEFIFDVL